MLRKLVPLAALLILAGCGQYSRDVDRTPEQVSSALVDLDISDQPGAPGSDPSLAGGVKPIFKHEKTEDGVVWKVMSGDDVAITMIAHLVPLDGGKRTRVTASVERGDAPDDFVSPAFRSEGIALGLFTMAIEDELNDLTRPAAASVEDCQAVLDRFAMSNMSSADLQEQTSRADAVGDVAKIALKMHGVDAELRRMGCDAYRNGGGGSVSPRRPSFKEWVGEDQASDDWGSRTPAR